MHSEIVSLQLETSSLDPKSMEPVQTTTNDATEQQNHQRYELDAEKTTVPD